MVFRFRKLRPGLIGTVLLFAAAIGAQALAPTSLERVSISATEQQGNGPSFGSSISGDGRFVVFSSEATNLTGLPTNRVSQIYLRDRQSGFTELASVGALTAGGPRQIANGDARNARISEDGRFVAFWSSATNLVAGDTNNAGDVFRRDRRGSTIRISASTAGAGGDQASRRPSMSGDGNRIAFQSDATNLAAGDTNAVTDVFVRDVATSTLARISTAAGGAQANGSSELPWISRDGNFVTFTSEATNLVPGDTNAHSDVFLKNLLTGEIKMVSVDPEGNPGDANSTFAFPSDEGRFVAFVSRSTNLVDDDDNSSLDVFVRDMEAGETIRVSVNSDGEEGDADSGFSHASPGVDLEFAIPVRLSADGRFVSFVSDATNLDDNDTNDLLDVFVRDLQTEETARISEGANGVEADADCDYLAMSSSGKYVSFSTAATVFLDDDTNDLRDVYVTTLAASGSGNTSPIADAGVDFEAAEQETVTLDGTGSFDLDDDELAFLWTQVSGRPVNLRNAATDSPFFRAPLAADTYQLTFQLSVSDGFNPATTDEVTVTVNPAEAASISGTVTTSDGTPVEGARVRIIRSDGQAATQVTTDLDGEYQVDDVRIGENTITADVTGFEPASVSVEVKVGDALVEDIVLEFPTAVLRGRVLLAKGSPLELANVDLIGGDGNVIGTAQTDSKGNYRITNLDRTDLLAIVAIRVKHPTVVTWTSSNPRLIASTVNNRDFRFGTLEVTVKVKPANAKKKLNGTNVEIFSGGKVVASNGASQRVRKLTFANVPATAFRVRASNPRLTGAQADVIVPSGPSIHKVTVTLRAGGRF